MGYGGQKFIEETYDRIAELREIMKSRNANCMIQIDGGVNPQNAQKLYEAGVNVLVAGSSVFNSANPVEAIHQLLNV